MKPREPLLALIRFHWAAGARVALRANAVVLGLVVFLFGSAPDGLAAFRAFLLGLASYHRPEGDRAILAAISAAFAATAVPRVTLGAAGWMRSLPSDAKTNWRAAVVALCMAQIAVATFIPFCVLAVVFVYHMRISPAKVVSLPLIVVAMAVTVLPVRRVHTRLIGGASVALAVMGTWPGIVGSIACLAFADASFPELAGAHTAKRRRKSFTVSSSSALAIWIRTSWRAMRPAGIAAAGALPAIIASYAYFIIGNNPELRRSTAETVVRVCGTLGVSLFAATLANAMLTNRQPWPWSRSLPWSSKQRVLADSFVLGIPLVIIPVGLLAVSVAQAAVVAALVPLAAVSGAAASRRGSDRQTGAAGETLLVTLAAAAALSMWPLASVVVLAATPLFVRIGARRDRDAVASRWSELHHEGAGDPGWLSRA
jgi:hypothetical protein